MKEDESVTFIPDVPNDYRFTFKEKDNGICKGDKTECDD